MRPVLVFAVLLVVKLTWNENPLDKWLTDTEALVPGNDMSFRVPNRDERRAIIAYLRSL